MFFDYITDQEYVSTTFPQKRKELDVVSGSLLSFLITGERVIYPSGTFWISRDSGRYSSNSYVVYLYIASTGEVESLLTRENPFYILPIEPLKSTYAPGKGDWTIPTWKNTLIDNFQNNYSDAIRKIRETSKLQNNWNSYNAVNISKTTRLRANNFLFELFRLLNFKHIVLPKPFVAACPNGSIQFEWDIEKKELEVIIPYSEKKEISFLRSYKDDYEKGSIKDPTELLEYMIWLIQNAE